MTIKATVGVNRQSVKIFTGNRRLNGILTVPPGSKRIVLFAHGSGSGRFSSRNQYVAEVLQKAGTATLLE